MQRRHGSSAGPAKGFALLVILGLGLIQTNPAAAQAFTSRAAFTAALPGVPSTSGFDGVAAGTTVASGGTVSGLTFTYAFGGQLLKVTSAYPATSPGNALGTSDADILQDGDNLTLTFAGRNALGLSIITKEVLQAGDLSLSAGGVTANIAPAVQQTLSDGANVYFLGVIRPTATFTSATLTTVGGGFFFYNVDDVTTATSPDTDGDGIANSADNCTLVVNANQRDTNGDGFGNLCDPDFNNNRLVDSQDGALLKAAFGSAAFPDRDLNGNGIVDSQDGAILKSRFGQPPGPSGLVP